MKLRGHEFPPPKSRSPWLFLAVALMLASAYCFLVWIGSVASISGWIGLPEYESRIPRLQIQAKVWSGLVIALPFVAAFILGLGRRSMGALPQTDLATSLTYRGESSTEKWLTPIVQYLGRLVVSVLGTLGFVVGIFLVGFLLHKLGLRTG